MALKECTVPSFFLYRRMEDAWARACALSDQSLVMIEQSRLRIEETRSSLCIATGLEIMTRTQALVRLDAWPT